MKKTSAVIIALLMVLATGAPGAAAPSRTLYSDYPGWKAPGYYGVAYSGEIWRVEPGAEQAYALTYPQWVSAGQPAPIPAQTDYVKYPWSDRIYGVTYFGSHGTQWLWDHLTAAQWSVVGKPKPRAAGFIAGSTYYRFNGTTELFVSEAADLPGHRLTFAEWQAAGSPNVPPEAMLGDVFRLSWDSSGTLLFDDFDADVYPIHPLTYASWRQLGFPTPQSYLRGTGDVAPHFNVYRTSPSDPTLSYINNAMDYSKVLTFAEWKALGSPPPADYYH
ncbi:hypothetical protein [Aeromicrobium sp. Leaf350]|uniref:hypothetical protein n=1 Tax=Aeromicrobium sp. Leaf350 TaxID=2876565 RepID=UPI001E5B777D|nr:hypothetical protein [Aeromicrobium sp. Leaf350]